jgi:hypothetical protein
MLPKLPAKSTKNRKRVVKEIEEGGNTTNNICFYYYEYNLVCLKIESSRSLKCASCAKKGLKCVDTSWKSLDETRKAVREKIEKDIEDLVEL